MSDESDEEFAFEENEPPARPKKEESDDDNDDDEEDYDDDAPISTLKKKATSTSASKKDTSKEKKAVAVKTKGSDKKKDTAKKRKIVETKSAPSKKVKKEVKTSRIVKKDPDEVKSGGASSSEKTRELKKLDKTERLQHAIQSFLWWDAKSPPEGYQWVTMEHAGVSFPEPYVPHGVKMLYNGKPVDLTPLEEEAATFFAAMDPDGMHLGNPKTAKIFIKNFFADFKEVLGKNHVIKDFDKCDFEPIRQHLNEKKIIRKAITDEEKKANK
jgi:DNA topoisomerase I